MRATVKRRSMPSADSIHWKPLRDAHYVLASLQPGDAYQHIFVEQAVLLRVHDIARSAPGEYTTGLLAGDRYEDPSTEARYVVVRALIEYAVPQPNEVAALGAIATLMDEHADSDVAILGWYCCGGIRDPRLTQSHAALHAAAFPHPWQAALRVSGDGRSGGFFLRDTREARWFTAPFFEMPPRARRGDQAKQTCIAWENYLTADSVVPVVRPQPTPPPPRAPRAPRVAARPETPREPRRPILRPRMAAAWSRIGPAARAAGVQIADAGRRAGPVAHRSVTAATSATRWFVTAAASATRRFLTGASVVTRTMSDRAMIVAAAVGERAGGAIASGWRSGAAHGAAAVRVFGSQLAHAGRAAGRGAAVGTSTVVGVVRRGLPRRPLVRQALTRQPPVNADAPATRSPDPAPAPLFRDTTASDSESRFIEVARIDGFFIAARFDGQAATREALWVLNDPKAGLLLTVTAEESHLRDATLHYQRGGEDALPDREPVAGHRAHDEGATHVAESCLESLRARCARLRTSGVLQREWHGEPAVDLTTAAERATFSGLGALRSRPGVLQALRRRRVEALPESVRRQFRLGGPSGSASALVGSSARFPDERQL